MKVGQSDAGYGSGKMKALCFSAWLFYITCIAAAPLLATTLTAEDCEITAVNASDEAINIWFAGRWSSNKKSLRFADTDKNGVVIMRTEEADTTTWEALRKRAQSAVGQRTTIRIATTRKWAMRGGIPMFKVPPAEVTLLSNDRAAEPLISQKKAIAAAVAYVERTEPNIEISPEPPDAEYVAKGTAEWRIRVRGVPRKHPNPHKMIYRCGSIHVGVAVSPSGNVKERYISCW